MPDITFIPESSFHVPSREAIFDLLLSLPPGEKIAFPPDDSGDLHTFELVDGGPHGLPGVVLQETFTPGDARQHGWVHQLSLYHDNKDAPGRKWKMADAAFRAAKQRGKK